MAAFGDDPSYKSSLKGHRGAVNSVNFNPATKQIVSGGDDHVVFVWNFPLDKRAFRFIGHKKPVTCVCFAPAGQLIASSSVDETVRLWEPKIKGSSEVLKCHQSPIRCVLFTNDGRQLITAADDKILKVFDVGEKKFALSLAGHRNWVRCASIDLADKIVLSGSDDRTVKLWDKQSGRCIKTIECPSGCTTSVGFQPGVGNCVAASFDSGAIRLWDSRTYGLLQLHVPSDLPTNGMAFHPNGNFIASASGDGQLRIHDLLEGRVCYTLMAHQGPVKCVAFSKNGACLASGSEDEQVMLWRTNLSSPVITPGKNIKPMNCADVPESRSRDVPHSNSATPCIDPVSKSVSGNAAPVTADASKGDPVRRDSDDDVRSRMWAVEASIEKMTLTIDVLVQTVSVLEQKLNVMEERFETLFSEDRHPGESNRSLASPE